MNGCKTRPGRLSTDWGAIPVQAGSYLVRVSERYHGYALSVKVGDRIKHYRISLVDKGYQLDGVNDRFETLEAIVSRYLEQDLPTMDKGSSTKLSSPLAVSHELGLGIDEYGELAKLGKKLAAEADQQAENSADAENDEVDDSPADDSVFLPPPVGQKHPRWLRGQISRGMAQDELRDRGMKDGRFIIRLKHR